MSVFNGKIALVTGAGSGIGRAISRILARDGARVVSADVNEKSAQETVDLLINPQDHFSLQVDVSNKSSIEKGFASITKRFGSPPILLAQAAGITKDNFLQKLEEQQFMDVINVNLKGTFLVQQQLVKHFLDSKEPEGAIVNISSIVAKHGNMGQSNYAASKAGIEAFTKTTAKELGKKGLRVNCVLPGFIETPMTTSVPENLMGMLLYVTPLKRMGKPEEIAEVVSFLLSEKSSFMTGAMVEVTGGLSI